MARWSVAASRRAIPRNTERVRSAHLPESLRTAYVFARIEPPDLLHSVGYAQSGSRAAVPT